MKFSNKKILVYGMGVSGKGAAKMLAEENADLILYDKNENLNREELLKELNLSEDTKVILGEIKDETLKTLDILALSPGVSYYAPDIEKAKSFGVEILGEIELAFEISKGRMVAITGTNGKTTTTSLVGEIMRTAFDEVYVVGNIGRSFAEIAHETTDKAVIVAEISSFQLESVKDFHPVVTAILNVTPDHLDRHGSFENYAETKLLVSKKQTSKEQCVINFDDEYLRELSKKINAEVVYFSRLEEPEKGVFLRGKEIVARFNGKETVICSRDELHLMGDHNIENVCAACAIAIAMNVPFDVISRVVKDFKAVEHRIEYVCTKNGVAYYNDSKGTNTDAAAKAVDSMVAPTVLIAGGYDKGADFTDWIKGFNGKIKDMILIGQTAEKIKETALKVGFNNIHMEDNLELAVKKAFELADKGDAVLLSPACASWGQFKNYEERGRMFKDFAKALPDEK